MESPRFPDHLPETNNPNVVVVVGEQEEEDEHLMEKLRTETRIKQLLDNCLLPNVATETFCRNMHLFSDYIEELEQEYQEQSGQKHGAFDEDLRQHGYKVGWALEVVTEHSEFLDVILVKFMSTRRPNAEHRSIQTAICRALVANMLGLNSQVVAMCANDMSLVDLLAKLVINEEPPLRCYATGLLAGGMLDRGVQDHIVKTFLMDSLFGRLMRSNLPVTGRLCYAFPEEPVDSEEGKTGGVAVKNGGGISAGNEPKKGSASKVPNKEAESSEGNKNDDGVDDGMPAAFNFGEGTVPIQATILLQKECSYAIQCIACLGEYQETLKPILESDVLSVILPLLRSVHKSLRLDIVDLLWHLLAHKRFSSIFVDRGGVQLLLDIVTQHELEHPLHHCILLCFTGLSSLSSVMERVCKFEDDTPLKMMKHALRVLEAPREHHRRNAALFFSVSLAFPAFLRHFDSCHGFKILLRRLDSPLAGILTHKQRRRNMASGNNGSATAASQAGGTNSSSAPGTSGNAVASSASPGHVPEVTSALTTGLRTRIGTSASTPSGGVAEDTPPTEPRVTTTAAPRTVYRGKNSCERRIAHSLTMALRQFFRAHLALIANVVRRRMRFKRSQARNSSTARNISRGGRPRLDSWSSGPSQQVVPYRAVEIDDKAAKRNLAMIERHWQTAMPILIGSKWTPTDGFIKFGGARPLLQIIAVSNRSDMKNPFLVDASAFALDALKIATLVPSICEDICSKPLDGNSIGVSVLLNAAAGSLHDSPKITKAALEVLYHCVEIRHSSDCILHPFPNLSNNRSSRSRKGPRNAQRQCNCRHSDDSVQKRMRKLLRSKDAIKVCFQLLRYRRVAAQSDNIKHKVSRVLLGLARDRQVAQIIGKMNIGKLISEIRAKGPVLEAYMLHFKRFCVYSNAIINLTGGRSRVAADATESAVQKMERAKVINRSTIRFSKDELLGVIRQHLTANGLFESARVLAEEAKLGNDDSSQKKLKSKTFAWPKTKHGQITAAKSAIEKGRGGTVTPDKTVVQHTCNAPVSGGGVLNSKPSLEGSKFRKRPRSESMPNLLEAKLSSPTRHLRPLKMQKTKAASMLPTSTVMFASRFLVASPKPIKRSSSAAGTAEMLLNKNNETLPSGIQTEDRIKFKIGKRTKPLSSRANPRNIFLPNAGEADKKRESGPSSPSSRPGADPLTHIVKEYLRGKISMWSKPIEVLPTLSLVEPQACPEGRPCAPWDAPQNVAHQVMSRQLVGGTGGRGGRTKSHEIVYSNFRKIRVFRDDEAVLTCSTFLNHVQGEPSCHFAACGNDNGQVRIYNMWNTEIVTTFSAHEAALASVATSPAEGQKNRLLLTSSTVFQAKLFDLTKTSSVGGSYTTFSACYSPSFSHSGDRIIGSKVIESDDRNGSSQSSSVRETGPRHQISIYDVETGVEMISLDDTSNGYTYPISSAKFDVTDNVIVCDGKLWDVRTKRLLYRFDKLGNMGHASFHPSGNQLLIDSAVWDLRTRKLVQVVPALDRCEVEFSSLGDALFAYPRPATGSMLREAQKEVRILHGGTYGDLGKPLPLERFATDLCVDNTDGYMLVTDHGFTPNDCRVNLFEIGRRKPNEADSDMDDAQDDSESEEHEDDDDRHGMSSPFQRQSAMSTYINDVMELESFVTDPGMDGDDDDIFFSDDEWEQSWL
jgi:hypothetical protein